MLLSWTCLEGLIKFWVKNMIMKLDHDEDNVELRLIYLASLYETREAALLHSIFLIPL